MCQYVYTRTFNSSVVSGETRGSEIVNKIRDASQVSRGGGALAQVEDLPLSSFTRGRRETRRREAEAETEKLTAANANANGTGWGGQQAAHAQAHEEERGGE